jgi:transglutaminase-like putative cysteine protease
MPSRVPPDERAAVRHYRVRHVTRYRYQPSVELSQHLLHLEPRPLPGRQQARWSLAVEPTPSVTAKHLDCFGNPVTYLAIQEPHDALTLTSDLAIEVRAAAAVDLAATPSWESLRAALAAAAAGAAVEAAEFAHESSRVPLVDELLGYAVPSFPAGRPIGLAARDLALRIHDDFVFDPAATTVATPLGEVLATRRGVCQDLAHVGIGALRALGLAARYVSGYLRTHPPPGRPRLRGSDMSHAWISVWCGGGLWLDLDPTNDKTTPLDYVTVAWGRDFGDVSPARGILFGGGSHTLDVMVDVEPVAGAG